jgi:hypothetical protein
VHFPRREGAHPKKEMTNVHLDECQISSNVRELALSEKRRVGKAPHNEGKVATFLGIITLS